MGDGKNETVEGAVKRASFYAFHNPWLQEAMNGNGHMVYA